MPSRQPPLRRPLPHCRERPGIWAAPGRACPGRAEGWSQANHRTTTARGPQSASPLPASPDAVPCRLPLLGCGFCWGLMRAWEREQASSPSGDFREWSDGGTPGQYGCLHGDRRATPTSQDSRQDLASPGSSPSPHPFSVAAFSLSPRSHRSLLF